MKEFLSNINIILHKKQKKQILILTIMMIVSALLEVCSISFVLPIISSLLDKDFMNTNSYAKSICSLLNINSYTGFVVLSVCILLVIFLLKNLFLIFKSNYHAKFALDFQYDLRNKVLHKYLEKDYSFYFNNNSSDIYKTLLDDVGKVYASFDGLLRILTDSIISLFLTITIFVIDWRLSLGMIIVVLLISLIISWLIRPVIRKKGEIAYAAARKRNIGILEALQGIKTVKITEKGGYFENKVSKADLEFSKAERTHSIISNIPRMILELVSITSFLLLVVVLVLLGNDFDLLIPKIGAIGLAFIKLLPGANSIISNVANMRYRTPSIDRVATLMQEKDNVRESGYLPEKYENTIEINNLSFKYERGNNYILDEANLSIPIGKMIGIVGPSGEGKTTFVDILLGLLPLESGSILVDGNNVFNNISKWRQSIGYITQDVFLLDDTIKANVAFGVEEKDISGDLIWEVLEKAQIADFVRSLSEGIDTNIGEKGIKLSGGQCQRIGIARALYNKPQILIFDEATSSLDSNTEKAVVDAINGLYGKHTMIIIAHRSMALERCDEIYKIENGKFIIE